MTERTAKAQALSCKRFDREADEDHLGVTYRKESGDSVIVKREALYRQSKQGGTARRELVPYSIFAVRDFLYNENYIFYYTKASGRMHYAVIDMKRKLVL